MATLNPAIFRAYDIRGITGEDFDAGLAQRLGSRVAAYLKAGVFVVGRDVRASSDKLAYAVVDGALHIGAQVIDIGAVSTPQFSWAVRSLGAVGGLMVTASHNPDRYNGFKAVALRDGVLEVLGGHQLRQIYDGHEHAHRLGGAVTKRDVVPDYADAIAYAAGWQGGHALRVAVDAPAPVRRVLERLGPIAPDHGLAVRFDADGDRIAFYERGEQLPADLVFLLLVERLHVEPVVFDLRFSRAVRERLDRLKTGYVVSAVGRLAMTRAMQQTAAVFGAEISGHFYWRTMGGVEAPELTLLQVYRLVQESGATLSHLLEPYRLYVKSPEISIPIKDKKAAEAVLAQLRDMHADGRINQADGLMVEYDDWWFNVRPSNTEPVLRLVVEAIEKDLLDRKVAEILEQTRSTGPSSF